MTTDEALDERGSAAVDEEFIRRALADADINALRLALYQATGDESLLAVRLKVTPVYGGARRSPVWPTRTSKP